MDFIVSTKKRNYEMVNGAKKSGETTCRSVKDLDAANCYKILRKCPRSTPVEPVLCSLVCHSLEFIISENFGLCLTFIM